MRAQGCPQSQALLVLTQMARLSIKTRRGVLIAALSDYQVLIGGIASRLGTGEPHVTCQETHSKASNLPTGPQDGRRPRRAYGGFSPTTWLAPHTGSSLARHLELLFGGSGRVETPRPGPEKLGRLDQTETSFSRSKKLVVFGFGFFLHECDLLGLAVYVLVTFPLELRHEAPRQPLAPHGAGFSGRPTIHDKGYNPALKTCSMSNGEIGHIAPLG